MVKDPAALDALCRALVEQAPLLFLGVDFDGVIFFASAGVERILGTDPSEIIGSNVTEWVHPDDMHRAADYLSIARTLGLPPGITRFRVLHDDGSWREVEAFGSVVDDGSSRYFAVYGRDAQHQLFLETLVEDLLNHAPLVHVLRRVLDAVQWPHLGSRVAVTYSQAGSWEIVSTGLPAELAGGADPFRWAPTRHCLERRAPVEGRTEDLDEPHRTLAAEAGLASFLTEPVVWSEEAPPALVTVWTRPGTSTPRLLHTYGVRIAAHLSEMILRWTDQTDRLRTAVSELEASRALQRKLVHDIGHEVRTPLTSIRTNIELLVRHGRALPDDVFQRMVQSLSRENDELVHLVEELLELAHAGSDDEPRQQLRVDELVVREIERLELRTDQEVRARLSPWSTLADERGLSSAVANLLGNAVKFGGGQPIEVVTFAGQVTVRDHGPGIPAGEEDRIFDRFFRSASTAPVPGSGLGLAIVKDFVEAHGGEVSARNAPGGGAEVGFQLPALLDQDGDRDEDRDQDGAAPA